VFFTHSELRGLLFFLYNQLFGDSDYIKPSEFLLLNFGFFVLNQVLNVLGWALDSWFSIIFYHNP